MFSFFLEGYQNDWSKPAQSGEFSYRDLPPGKYRLLARCADSWQNWSETAVVVSVTLRPPFWRTTWFLVLLLLATTVLTAFVARKINSLRYTRKIRALEQQNAVEKERLRIAKDMHDDLGASLTRISILSELAKKQEGHSQKVQQVISQISEISGGVVDDMSEIIWALNPRNDTLDSFTAYIRQYASSYLESAGLEVRFLFPGSVPAILMSSELRRNLFLIVKEALHNVVKHAGAKNVHLELLFSEPVLRINLADDGQGFSDEKVQGTGNGLQNMRKRAEEIGGRFDMESKPGFGTTIHLTVTMPAPEISH
jgi:signal transduction histidine kinase